MRIDWIKTAAWVGVAAIGVAFWICVAVTITPG